MIPGLQAWMIVVIGCRPREVRLGRRKGQAQGSRECSGDAENRPTKDL